MPIMDLGSGKSIEIEGDEITLRDDLLEEPYFLTADQWDRANAFVSEHRSKQP